MAEALVDVTHSLALRVPDDAIVANLVSSGTNEGVAHQVLARAKKQYKRELRAHETTVKKALWFMDVFRILRKLDSGIDELPPGCTVGEQEFFEQYYRENRPLLIRKGASDTAAARLWTPEYLKSHYGDIDVEAMFARKSDPDYELHHEQHRRKLKLKDFVDCVLSAGQTNDVYMVAVNRTLRGMLREILSDLQLSQPFLNQPLSPRTYNMWFGPAGTVTKLHHDPSNNALIQIYGRKSVVLIAPWDSRFVYNSAGAHCEVDVDCREDIEQTNLKYATLRRVVLEPGDLLFIPVGWWHQVQALDVSITISTGDFLWPNIFPLDSF